MLKILIHKILVNIQLLLQLFGGYWFHEVGAVLDNPNWILSKLGYAATRESEHIWELSPDISVETLGEIHWASLDCFVAAVECQVHGLLIF